MMSESIRVEKLEIELTQAREAVSALAARLENEASQRAASDAALAQRISAMELHARV